MVELDTSPVACRALRMLDLLNLEELTRAERP